MLVFFYKNGYIECMKKKVGFTGINFLIIP